MTPAEFWKSVKDGGAEVLSGVEIPLYCVIEIDDGLNPVCFCRTENGYTIVPYFDTAAARSNELGDAPDNSASPDS